MIENTLQYLSCHVGQIHTLRPKVILHHRNMIQNGRVEHLATFLFSSTFLTPTAFSHAYERSDPFEGLLLGEDASLVSFLQTEVEICTVLRLIADLFCKKMVLIAMLIVILIMILKPNDMNTIPMP